MDKLSWFHNEKERKFVDLCLILPRVCMIEDLLELVYQLDDFKKYKLKLPNVSKCDIVKNYLLRQNISIKSLNKYLILWFSKNGSELLCHCIQSFLNNGIITPPTTIFVYFNSLPKTIQDIIWKYHFLDQYKNRKQLQELIIKHKFMYVNNYCNSILQGLLNNKLIPYDPKNYNLVIQLLFTIKDKNDYFEIDFLNVTRLSQKNLWFIQLNKTSKYQFNLGDTIRLLLFFMDNYITQNTMIQFRNDQKVTKTLLSKIEIIRENDISFYLSELSRHNFIKSIHEIKDFYKNLITNFDSIDYVKESRKKIYNNENKTIKEFYTLCYLKILKRLNQENETKKEYSTREKKRICI